MDAAGGDDTGDTTPGTMSSGSSVSDTMAKSGRAEADDETGEIPRPTAGSVARSLLTFLVGLGVFVALLYGLSIVLNSY
ncbi:hypothetical protein [Halosimplex halophilum]|uniref:hypothetical protein n=1 Tax=Halosimplex halophilum TaxID=2559572 RepID=UPI00107FA09A|nr:hypothetical protein [Halosimplex halophilum]